MNIKMNPIVGFDSKNFITISNFLSKIDRDRIFNQLCEHSELFHQIGIPNSDFKGSLHLSLEEEHPENAKVRIIKQATNSITEKVIEILPSIFKSLGIQAFPVSHIPLSIINGFDGHTGIPHTDESGGRYKISILYYLHKNPKEFKGGDLELYETDLKSTKGYKEVPFAKINHEDNQLIIFPSEVYHGVTDVVMESDNFEDGRFVIVGFLG